MGTGPRVLRVGEPLDRLPRVIAAVPSAAPTTTCMSSSALRRYLRKLRGKNLVVRPGRSRRYQTPAPAARTIAALLALRDQVIAPILAGVRSPRRGRKPAHWTLIDRDYETLRIAMQALFHDLGITPRTPAAA